eukprot:m.32714 g.32714  ORF g.32714 m.32714 type:complete len:408 (+) comp12456_c0_seq1:28-1251(+)
MTTPTYRCVGALSEACGNDVDGCHTPGETRRDVVLCALDFAGGRHQELPGRILEVLCGEYTLVDPHSAVHPLAAAASSGEPASLVDGGVLTAVGGTRADAGPTRADTVPAAASATVAHAPAPALPSIGGFVVVGSANLLVEFPESLCSPAIFSLDLSSNRLTSVSPRLCAMTNLTAIDLRNNQIESLPPDSLSSLVHLSYLNVSNNQLAKLPRLPTSLLELQAGRNQLTGLRSALEQGLPRLKVLMLSWNQLASLPPTVSSMVQLEELDARHNQLQRLPPQIGGLRRLKRLTLYSNMLEQIPAEIGGLEQLEHLDVLRNTIHMGEDAVHKILMSLGTRAAVQHLHRGLYWRCYLHRSAPYRCRVGIQATLFSGYRCCATGSLPRLPPECWFEVFQKVLMQWTPRSSS